MPARKLDRSIDMLDLRREIVWSRIACQADPAARVHAPRFEVLLEEWQRLQVRVLLQEDALLQAEYLVVHVDLRCDTHVDDFNSALLGVVRQDRTDEHYVLYFREPPSRIKRPVLGVELDTLRDWVVLLAEETDPRLVLFRAVFAEDVKAADEALAALDQAEGALRHSREVGEIASFIVRVETVRDEVYAALDQHRAEHPELGLPRDYASSFFLKAPRREPTEEERRERAEAKARARAEAEMREEKRKQALERLRAARRELAELER